MKAWFSEDYYYTVWDQMLERVPGEDYRNLEAELERKLAPLQGMQISEQDMLKIKRVYAKPIADSCEALVRKEMKTWRQIEAGEASFGHITESQEYRARADFHKRFEFNCLQLRDFKRKYGL